MTQVGTGKYTYTRMENFLSTMWTGMGGPNDIARDKDGIFCICEQESGSDPAYICTRDGVGTVLAQWETRHAHGLAVNAHGDIYVALSTSHHADKYVRNGSR